MYPVRFGHLTPEWVPRNWQGGGNLGVVGSRSRDVTGIQNCTRDNHRCCAKTLSVATVDGVASLNHGSGTKLTNFWQELWSEGAQRVAVSNRPAQCSVPMKWLVFANPWRRVGQSDEDGMVTWVLPCLTNALPGRTTLMDASNEITDQQLHFLPENLSCLNWGFRVGWSDDVELKG